MGRRLAPRRGIALIMALAIMVIFFTVTVAFSTIVGYEYRTSKENQIASMALYATDAGLQFSMAGLRSIIFQFLQGSDISSQVGQYSRDGIVKSALTFWISSMAQPPSGASDPARAGLVNLRGQMYGSYKISADAFKADGSERKASEAAFPSGANPCYIYRTDISDKQSVTRPDGSRGRFNSPPEFGIYRLRLRAVGTVMTEDGVILGSRNLKVEILVNSYRAGSFRGMFYNPAVNPPWVGGPVANPVSACKVYRWYDEK